MSASHAGTVTFASVGVILALLTPIPLLEIVWSALGAAVFFHQPIGLVQVAGMTIVMCGVVGWVRAEAGTLPG